MFAQSARFMSLAKCVLLLGLYVGISTAAAPPASAGYLHRCSAQTIREFRVPTASGSGSVRCQSVYRLARQWLTYGGNGCYGGCSGLRAQGWNWVCLDRRRTYPRPGAVRVWVRCLTKPGYFHEARFSYVWYPAR